MIRWLGLALAVAVTPAVAGPVSDGSVEAPEPRTIEVRMVDKSPTEFAFEPAEITVRPGDTVVFVQAGVMPHNVEFKDTPSGVALGGLEMGPFLTVKGQTYEVVIDDRFEAGEYPYVCTPHEAMGMKGTITVVASGN